MNNKLQETTDELVAVAVSDVHLSLLKPRVRDDENWLDVQKHYMSQVYNLLSNWHVPIIFAGDLFDKPSCTPELINWCLRNLPEMYGVYGQHDIFWHRGDTLSKTAFGTMVQVGKIKLLKPNEPTIVNNLVLWGFPWNSKVVPCIREPRPDYLHVAVIHAMIWTKTTGFMNASPEKRLSSWLDKLKGYDIAIFGDNHKGFLFTKSNHPTILNNGTFIRRKVDEMELTPSVGLIYRSGKVVRQPLDVSIDKFVDKTEVVKVVGEEISLFMDELNSLESKKIDFPDVLRRTIANDNIEADVKDIVMKCLDKGAKE